MKITDKGENYTQKNHTLFETKKGIISLVHWKPEIYPKCRQYEIYCLKGNLFNDIEVFELKYEAYDRIRHYLDNNWKDNIKDFIDKIKIAIYVWWRKK